MVLDDQIHIPLVIPTTSVIKTFNMKISIFGSLWIVSLRYHESLLAYSYNKHAMTIAAGIV